MDKKDIFNIGIGTWKIDPENFEKDLEALKYSYENGQNYLALYMIYNNGQVVEKMKEFVQTVERDKIFICANLEKYIEKIEDVESQLDNYLRILNIDYVDCLQIHMFNVCTIDVMDVYEEIKRLVDVGKVKYIGVSNVSFDELKKINAAVKIDIFEGVYNLDCKYYENIGLLDYCNENGILFTAYQPLRRNKISQKNYDFLEELAEKYQKTKNQIMINWMVKQKKIVPIIKSTNKERIKENLESLSFEMDTEDYKLLNAFQNEKINSIQIDWGDGVGVTIDQLANQSE